MLTYFLADIVAEEVSRATVVMVREPFRERVVLSDFDKRRWFLGGRGPPRARGSGENTMGHLNRFRLGIVKMYA